MSRSRLLVRVGWAMAVGSVIVTAVLIALVATTNVRSVRIDPKRTVRGDLITTSARVDILGAVQGDVRARALYLRQVGGVSGDISVVAGRAELRGAVGGSVRAYGGSFSLYGSVGGDVEVYSGHLTIVEEAVIDGDLIVHGGSVTLIANSRVGGDVRGEAAQVTIEGDVDGDVDLSVWRLTIAPGATIGGSVRYESRTEASIADTASVRPETVRRVDPANRLPAGRILLWHMAAVPRYLMMLVMGCALVLAVPRTMVELADTARLAVRRSVLSGIAAVVFGPILLATLGLFVLTLPLVVVGAGLLILAMYLSMAVVGLAIGRFVLRSHVTEHCRALDLAAVGLGITVLGAARLVPVPYLDAGIAALTAIFGLGLILARFERARLGRAQRASRPVASFALGALAGSIVVMLGVLALAAAITGALATLATLSGSAQFTWEVAPRRLAATALALASTSLFVGRVALMSRRRGKSRAPGD